MNDKELMDRLDSHLKLIEQLTSLLDKVYELNRVSSERISLVNLRVDSLARQLDSVRMGGAPT